MTPTARRRIIERQLAFAAGFTRSAKGASLAPHSRRSLPGLLALGACLASCGPCGPKPKPSVDVGPVLLDAGAVRRPSGPPSPVRAYPPHAIRDDGVGPFLLGQNMQDALRELPEGPHLELLQVGPYANWRVSRAEQGAMVIGADARNQVAFISILQPEVARTPSGVGVGATGAELRAALGASTDEEVVRGRRVFTFAALPAVHFLTEAPLSADPAAAKVVAVVVARRAAEAEPRVERRPGCAAAPAASWDEILAASRAKVLPAAAEPPLASGCISAAVPEAVLAVGGELILVGGEPGKLKRLAALPLAAVDLLGVVDLDGDGREEIVSAAQRELDGEHAIEVRLFRWESGKLVEVPLQRPFSIDAATATAAGVRPGEIDVLVELRAVRGGLEVGGFYTARRGETLREVAPLSPAVLRVEPRRVAGGAAEPARVTGGDAPGRVQDAAPPPDAE